MRDGDEDAGGVVWQPTCLGDNVIVALSGVHQLVILFAVLHIAWAANWPPCESTAIRPRWPYHSSYEIADCSRTGPFDPP